MRVLLVNKFWYPVGGVEEHCLQIVDLLTEHGHDVVRFGMADEKNDPVLPPEQTVTAVNFREGALPHRISSVGRAVFGLQTRKRMGELLDRQRIDVAHVTGVYHQLGMTFISMLRRRGVPVLLDLHDYKAGCPSYRLFDERVGRVCTVCLDRPSGWAWAPSVRGCWGGSHMGGLFLSAEAATARITRAYRDADCVVVLNDLQRRAVLQAGVPETRVRMIPNWVATGEPQKRHAERHVLFVGRFAPEKGVDVLIQAAARGGVAVRVAGDGRLRKDLEDLAVAEGADVTFLGWCDRQTLAEELCTAAALVVPSIWPEVFALVICEAFGAGVPVIGTNLGGTADLLDGNRGFTYEPHDVDALATLLRRVIDDPSEADARANLARDFAAKEMTRQRWSERFAEAYESLKRPL